MENNLSHPKDILDIYTRREVNSIWSADRPFVGLVDIGISRIDRLMVA